MSGDEIIPVILSGGAFSGAAVLAALMWFKLQPRVKAEIDAAVADLRREAELMQRDLGARIDTSQRDLSARVDHVEQHHVELSARQDRADDRVERALSGIQKSLNQLLSETGEIRGQLKHREGDS